jgi:LemA protein
MVWLVLLVFVAPAAIFIASYNRLLTARIALKNAFAQIDVLLTRCYGLLPNLIESARERLEGEHAALDALLADCRATRESLKGAAGDAGGAAAVDQLAGVDRQLGGALRALRALLLRHPDLEGTAVMTALAEELTTTQTKVSLARQAYNRAVRIYNIGRLSFPGKLAAEFFGFAPAYPLPEEPQASACVVAHKAVAREADRPA